MDGLIAMCTWCDDYTISLYNYFYVYYLPKILMINICGMLTLKTVWQFINCLSEAINLTIDRDDDVLFMVKLILYMFAFFFKNNGLLHSLGICKYLLRIRHIECKRLRNCFVKRKIYVFVRITYTLYES